MEIGWKNLGHRTNENAEGISRDILCVLRILELDKKRKYRKSMMSS